MNRGRSLAEKAPEVPGQGALLVRQDEPAPDEPSRARLSWRPAALEGLAVTAASGGYAAVLLAFSYGHPASTDTHYHFSVAREIAHGAFVPDVAHGLPLSVLHEMPVDHYWGYHVLLAPFSLVPGAELAMTIAVGALFAGVSLATWFFLRARGVVCSWIWALVPMLFSTQDWRFLQLHGAQVVLPLLFAMTAAAFCEPRRQRRQLALLAIGYIAMLSYHGAVVLLPFHVGGVAALALLRPRSGVPRLVDPAITAAGLALGLTVNPYMDARASTWRFAAFHVGEMGRDTARLYDDQEVAQFHGFSLRLLASHPEWVVLLVAVLLAVALVVWRARTEPERVGDHAIALAGMTVVGVILTAEAIRTREYSVPFAFAFLAVLASRRPARGFGTALLSTLLLAVAILHAEDTQGLPPSLPSREYEGARPILEANGDHPILNIAEADYSLLRFQYDRAVCVQGLSRYFIYPYPSLFHDVWELHDRADTSVETRDALKHFWDRGVRLVAMHRAHNAMIRFAETHPELLRLVFRAGVDGASIYAIDGAGLNKNAPP